MATSDPLISDEFRGIFQWICFAVVCQGLDIFGTVTNIINIMCFVKQGFKDPVNVKRIFSSERVSIIIVVTFIVLVCSVSPMYCVNSFAMLVQQGTNKTILGLIHSDNGQSVEQVSLIINNVIISFGSFATVIVCTVILVVKLDRKAKWRFSSVSTNGDTLLSRDQKVSRMIIIISTVFIICFTPSCVSFLAMTMEPGLAIDGTFKNTFIVTFGLGFILESANSSVNIFIYYNMSSKYRATFRQIVRTHCHEQQTGPKMGKS